MCVGCSLSFCCERLSAGYHVQVKLYDSISSRIFEKRPQDNDLWYPPGSPELTPPLWNGLDIPFPLLPLAKIFTVTPYKILEGGVTPQ